MSSFLFMTLSSIYLFFFFFLLSVSFYSFLPLFVTSKSYTSLFFLLNFSFAAFSFSFFSSICFRFTWMIHRSKQHNLFYKHTSACIGKGDLCVIEVLLPEFAWKAWGKARKSLCMTMYVSAENHISNLLNQVKFVFWLPMPSVIVLIP